MQVSWNAGPQLTWIGNNQYKKQRAQKHNKNYEDEKIAREVEKRRQETDRIERLRQIVSMTKNGKPCEVNIDDAGTFIVPGEGEYEVTTKEDCRGPIIIGAGEYGRMVAREHIERIKSGHYTEIGIVPQKPFDPHWYRRSRW